MAASADVAEHERNFCLFLSGCQGSQTNKARGQVDPIRFEPLSKVATIFFDEANRQVFTVRLNGMSVVVKGPDEKIDISLPNKGELRSIKFSSDRKILAMQRSPQSVDFMNFAAGLDLSEYSQTCKGKCTNILSFFWMGLYDIVYVTDQGLEYYQVLPEKRCLKLIKSHSLSVNWSTSLAESSVVVVSSGSLGNYLYPFHFKAGVVTKLPKFEVDLPVLPQTPPQIPLKATDVTLAMLYGHLYAIILRHDAGSMISELVLYQIPTSNSATESSEHILAAVCITMQAQSSFFKRRESVTTASRTEILRLNLTGSQFSLNVVDNLIIVHHQASKISMMFDIKLNGSSQPAESNAGPIYHNLFVSPLPIRPLKLTNTSVSSAGATAIQEVNCELYSPTWVIFQPDIVLDAKLGCVWFLRLRLESLVSMMPDKCRLVQFLLARRDSKKVILDICRSMLSPGERQCDLSQIATIFDSLNRVYSQFIESSGTNGSKSPDGNERKTPVIDQSDMYTNVFSVFDDTDYKFEVAAVTEYIRSLGLFHIPVQAFSLLSLESCYPPSYQLALDMLKRMTTANDSILEVLLSKQQLLSAIRFIQSTGSVDQASARKFLEAALNTNNDRVFFTVFRFFEQRNLRLRTNSKFLPGEHCEAYVEHFKQRFGSDSLN